MKGTIRSLTAVAVFAAAGAAQASTYSSLWVFGDSLSDNGNLFAKTGNPPAPYWNGRFSNGPVAAETMASIMGVPLVDFAIGGAKTGPNPVGGSDFIDPAMGGLGLGMLAQVDRAVALPGTLSSSALYMVWAGPNDFFAMGATPPDVTVGTAVVNVADAITQLYAEGARHFFVPLTPDFGLTPDARDAGNQADQSALSGAYNAALLWGLGNLDKFGLPDGDIQFFDTYAYLHGVVANPGANGLLNVTDACIKSAACVADGMNQGPALGYLFWDGVHPTTFAHEQLGTAFAAAVPEPETYAMFLAGLGILGAIARRRRA